MIEKIAEKFVLLSKKKPFSPQIQRYLCGACRMEWIWCCLHLDGSAVSREQIEQIIEGGLVRDISLGEYSLIDRYWGLFRKIDTLLGLTTELSETVLLKLYDELFPGNEGYRRGNPILLQWNYNPPHFKDVGDSMRELFHWYARAEYPGNPLMKAAVLHQKMMVLYPFGEDTGVMARLALLYHLMFCGLYPFMLNLSESEYNDTICLYLKDQDAGPLYRAVERGVYNRLEVLLQMAAED